MASTVYATDKIYAEDDDGIRRLIALEGQAVPAVFQHLVDPDDTTTEQPRTVATPAGVVMTAAGTRPEGAVDAGAAARVAELERVLEDLEDRFNKAIDENDELHRDLEQAEAKAEAAKTGASDELTQARERIEELEREDSAELAKAFEVADQLRGRIAELEAAAEKRQEDVEATEAAKAADAPAKDKAAKPAPNKAQDGPAKSK